MKQDRDSAAIKPGTPETAAVASALLYLTMGRMADYWMGVDNSRVAHAILARLYQARGNLFSHQFAEYAEVSGQVAGFFLSYPAVTMKKLELRTVLQYLGAGGIANSIRMVARSYPLRSIVDGAPDEYFLAHIAVLPEHEGRGLGRMLLERAEARARECALSKITLTVDTDNARAMSLYLRAGFTVTSTVNWERLNRRFAYHGYHHMQKLLA